MSEGTVSQLRGLVYSQYTSIAALARALGWNVNKVKRVIKGEQEVTLKEAKEMSQALGISIERMCDIFLQ